MFPTFDKVALLSDMSSVLLCNNALPVLSSPHWAISAFFPLAA